ncbi:MAG: UPF0182 family protein [Gemmatimonadota bacterium]|nr:UPF0182 family protein [Gemmatimonadota bacterium]
MRRWLVLLAVSSALALLGGRAVAGVFADWLWFDSMGALDLYRSQLAHEAAWRAGAGLAGFAFAFLNLYAVRRSIVSLVLPRRLGNIEIGEVVSARALLAGVAVTAAILGVALSAPTVDWTVLAFARIAQPFRELDPFLDRDLSYGVARLPLEFGLYEWAGRAMLVVSAVIVVLYALTPSLRLRPGHFYISVYCRRHLAALAALALLLLAWSSRLDNLALTVTGPEPGGGYGAFAHRVDGPFLAWASILTVVAAFIVYWTMWHGQARAATLAVLFVCVGVPLGRATLPYFTGRMLSSADLRDAERPYANARTLFTRRAFGVDAIDTAWAPGGLPQTVAEALPGIPAWDPAALLRSVPGASLRRDSAWVAWQRDPDGLRAIAVTPVHGQPDTWAAAPFDAAAEGDRGQALSALPQRGAPPIPASWDRLVAYPGARAPLVVWDTAGHLPAPSFVGWGRRIALAWRVRTPALLLRDDAGTRPRLAFRRDVLERVHALAPFLTPGPTITPLLRGDTLYWAVDLFTTSATYPLAERIFFAGETRTYVHEAGTALVQAATGRVLLVAARNPDAILRAWMRRFPDLFTSAELLPAALAAARPPSVDWAGIQATALARSGRGPAPASTRAAVATDNADAGAGDGPPSLFAISGARPALAWSTPMVNAAGMVSGLVVAVGGERPRTAWVRAAGEQAWMDLLDRLQRAADSAGVGRQRRGARRGRVLAIPTAAGIAYVQSHYEWTSDGPPALAGVAGVARGQARAGTSRQAALGLPVPRAGNGSSWRSAVSELYQRMADALRRADWPAFGAAFEALGRLLRGPGR